MIQARLVSLAALLFSISLSAQVPYLVRDIATGPGTAGSAPGEFKN